MSSFSLTMELFRQQGILFQLRHLLIQEHAALVASSAEGDHGPAALMGRAAQREQDTGAPVGSSVEREQDPTAPVGSSAQWEQDQAAPLRISAQGDHTPVAPVGRTAQGEWDVTLVGTSAQEERALMESSDQGQRDVTRADQDIAALENSLNDVIRLLDEQIEEIEREVGAMWCCARAA